MKRAVFALFVAVVASAAEPNPADRLLSAYFERKGVHIPPPAPDAVFARRAWLDLWGVPPSPEQLKTFLEDRRPDKRERLVDQLLAGRKKYAEKWISFWNDLLRNDEGVEYEGARQSITAWLLRALEENLPYDRFVTALLNPTRPDDPAGFLIGVNWRGDVSASQTPPMQAAQNSAQVFLGVNLKCNSCHDSFISRWKLKDAYGLAGFFSEKQLEIHRCDVATGEMAQPKFLYPGADATPPDAPLPVRRAAAARLFVSDSGRLSRTLVNRFWKELIGRAIVEPVDDMEAEPWDAALLDGLASDFVAHGYDMQHLLRRIMTSVAYQLPAVRLDSKPGKAYVFEGPLYRRLTAEQFADSISAITGEWRILAPRTAGGEGRYTREWMFKSSALSTALGRPIRDQVVTERNEEATTLQLLELTNGSMLDKVLYRGAARIAGKLPPAPPNLFDSGVVSKTKAQIDIDITGLDRLWLLLEDTNSYDPSQIVAGWANAELIGPAGKTRLADLKESARLQRRRLQIKDETFENALVAPVPTRLVYNIAGKGFTRFRATVGVDNSSVRDYIGPRVRFFAFASEPDPDQLVRVRPETPFPASPFPKDRDARIVHLYRYALARDPSPGELRTAHEFTDLEDLLWSVFMSPEFQFIR